LPFAGKRNKEQRQAEMVIHKDDELSDSELLDMMEEDMEDDSFMAGYREQRLEQMKRE
jgi:hypothetical protein